MAGRGIFSIRDASNEVSTTSIPGVNLNAGNIAAQTTLIGDLSDAIQDVIVGHLFQEKAFAFETDIAGAVSSPFAQRELKWLVTLRESGGAAHTMEIATPDAAKLVSGSDLANMADTDIIALIAAIEAFYRFNGTIAATVETIRLVGRNL